MPLKVLPGIPSSSSALRRCQSVMMDASLPQQGKTRRVASWKSRLSRSSKAGVAVLPFHSPMYTTAPPWKCANDSSAISEPGGG